VKKQEARFKMRQKGSAGGSKYLEVIALFLPHNYVQSYNNLWHGRARQSAFSDLDVLFLIFDSERGTRGKSNGM